MEQCRALTVSNLICTQKKLSMRGVTTCAMVASDKVTRRRELPKNGLKISHKMTSLSKPYTDSQKETSRQSRLDKILQFKTQFHQLLPTSCFDFS
jgi:hypothetical protein